MKEDVINGFKFLINFFISDKSENDFEWFETEEEMNDFIKCNGIEDEDIFDKIEILNCRQCD